MEMGVVNVAPMKLLSIKMKIHLTKISLIKKIILHEASEMDHQLTLRKILIPLTVSKYEKNLPTTPSEISSLKNCRQ